MKVFGFDDSYLNRVLEYFQRFGQIAHYSKGKGNWVLLEYATRVEAQSACKMNGKPIEDKVVIGVVLPDHKRFKIRRKTNHHTNTKLIRGNWSLFAIIAGLLSWESISLVHVEVEIVFNLMYS